MDLHWENTGYSEIDSLFEGTVPFRERVSGLASTLEKEVLRFQKSTYTGDKPLIASVCVMVLFVGRVAGNEVVLLDSDPFIEFLNVNGVEAVERWRDLVRTFKETLTRVNEVKEKANELIESLRVYKDAIRNVVETYELGPAKSARVIEVCRGNGSEIHTAVQIFNILKERLQGMQQTFESIPSKLGEDYEVAVVQEAKTSGISTMQGLVEVYMRAKETI